MSNNEEELRYDYIECSGPIVSVTNVTDPTGPSGKRTLVRFNSLSYGEDAMAVIYPREDMTDVPQIFSSVSFDEGASWKPMDGGWVSSARNRPEQESQGDQIPKWEGFFWRRWLAHHAQRLFQRRFT